jgi:DNA-binding MarR family transcriptional regulator
MAEWKFLTNHAHVLLCVAHEPEILLREIADAVGITERAAHRIIAELEEGGYISRERKGRRNFYRFHPDAVMRHPNLQHSLLGELTLRELVEPLINPRTPALNGGRLPSSAGAAATAGETRAAATASAQRVG